MNHFKRADLLRTLLPPEIQKLIVDRHLKHFLVSKPLWDFNDADQLLEIIQSREKLYNQALAQGHYFEAFNLAYYGSKLLLLDRWAADPSIPAKEYWSCVRCAVVSSHQTVLDSHRLRRILTSEKGSLADKMSDQELDYLRSLGSPIQIFRGADAAYEGESAKGHHWTTNRDVAVAVLLEKACCVKTVALLEAEVELDNVGLFILEEENELFAYHESEIVVIDPSKLNIVGVEEACVEDCLRERSTWQEATRAVLAFDLEILSCVELDASEPFVETKYTGNLWEILMVMVAAIAIDSFKQFLLPNWVEVKSKMNELYTGQLGIQEKNQFESIFDEFKNVTIEAVSEPEFLVRIESLVHVIKKKLDEANYDKISLEECKEILD